MRAGRDWRQYWLSRTSASSRTSDEHHSAVGRELALLTDDPTAKRVLDIGCGTGALYEPLGLDRAAVYRGIDFSPAMLGSFRQRVPGVDVVQADAATYEDGDTYDLIFSNGVVQYFSKEAFSGHLNRVQRMAAKGGVLVHANIPNALLRRPYLRGGVPMGGTEYNPILGRLVSEARHWAGRDSIGRWWHADDICVIGRAAAWRVECFGSMLYPYRFHVRLTR